MQNTDFLSKNSYSTKEPISSISLVSEKLIIFLYNTYIIENINGVVKNIPIHNPKIPKLHIITPTISRPNKVKLFFDTIFTLAPIAGIALISPKIIKGFTNIVQKETKYVIMLPTYV